MSTQLNPQTPNVFGRVATKKWLLPIILMTMMVLSLVYFSGYACKILPQEYSPCPIICPPGKTCLNIGTYWICV